MKLKVILTGPLSKYGKGQRELMIEVNDGMRAGDLMTFLGIPAQSYSFVSIRGRKAGDDCELMDHDVITVFPPVSGG
jgi:molybdopterin converting factor small subunit